jgi:GTP cyclohydrolase II
MQMTASKEKKVPTKGVVRAYAAANLPTHLGTFSIMAFRDPDGNLLEDVALVRGEVRGKVDVPTRVHSQCVTGEVFGSLRCDCRDQLEMAMERLAEEDYGVVLYLRQEGRGIGIAEKVRAYSLQDQGMDTVEANSHLGFEDDLRTYEVAAAMLDELGIVSVALLTNNPRKVEGLADFGVDVTKRLPLRAQPREQNRDYLATKAKKSGHLL